MRVKNRSAMLFAVLLLIGGAAFGQGTTGSLVGTVTTEGAGLPGVTVTITSPALQGTRTAVTGDNGGYSFPALPPGDYTVDVRAGRHADGHAEVCASTSRRPAAPTPSCVRRHVSEAITVTAVGAGGARDDRGRRRTSRSEQIAELPTLHRTITTTALLAPGVNDAGPNKQITISGAPSFDNLFLVNGVVVNENLRGQPHNLFIEDAIQETTVLTGGDLRRVRPLHRRRGQRRSPSRAATSSRGSLRDCFRNDDWTVEEPRLRRSARPITLDEINSVYEGTLGGRIIRDRLWFFGAGRKENDPRQRRDHRHRHPVRRRRATRRAAKASSPARSRSKHSAGRLVPRHEAQRGRTTASATSSTCAASTDRELPNTLSRPALQRRAHQQPPGRGAATTRWTSRSSAAAPRRATASTARCCATRPRPTAPGRRRSAASAGQGAQQQVRPGQGLVLPRPRRASASTASSAAARTSTSSASRTTTSRAATTASGATSSSSADERLLPRRTRRTRRSSITRCSRSRKGSDFAVRSLFVNDKWDLNNHFSFNVGVRYDKADGKNQADGQDGRRQRRSARASASIFDPTGNGRHRFSASYSKYVSKVDQGAGDATSPGRPLRVVLLELPRTGHQPGRHADEPARADRGSHPPDVRVVRRRRAASTTRRSWPTISIPGFTTASARTSPRRAWTSTRSATARRSRRAATSAPTSFTATGTTSTSSAGPQHRQGPAPRTQHRDRRPGRDRDQRRRPRAQLQRHPDCRAATASPTR